MAFRIHESVVRGQIDNRIKGRITGSLWLHGRKKPVTLNLEGNPHRDLAGCLLEFTATGPTVRLKGGLSAKQQGLAGDMTASRKVRIPCADDSDSKEEGKEIAWRWSNCLYLEWFSETEGRILLESTGFEYQISEPAWVMTAEEETRQIQINEESMRGWFEELAGDSGETISSPETDKPLNEFQWEQILRESDQKADAWMEVFEKYHDHPDADKKISEALGFEVEEGGDSEDGMPEVEISWEAVDVRSEPEEQEHPLSTRASDLALRLHQKASVQEARLNSGLQVLVGSVMVLAAKLAGALGPFQQDVEPDSGFVVACLKRALEPLHQSLQSCHDLGRQDPKSAEWLDPVRAELFEMRTEILDLMKSYRNRG